MAYGFREQQRHFRFREAPKTEEEAQARRFDYSAKKLAQWQVRRERGDYMDPKEVSEYRRALDAYVKSSDYFDFAAKMSQQEQARENRRLTALMDDMNRIQSMGKEEQRQAKTQAAWNTLRRDKRTAGAAWVVDTVAEGIGKAKAAKIQETAQRRERLGVTEQSSAKELYDLADRLDRGETVLFTITPGERGHARQMNKSRKEWNEEEERIRKEDAAWLRQVAASRLGADDIPGLEKEIEETDRAIEALTQDAQSYIPDMNRPHSKEDFERLRDSQKNVAEYSEKRNMLRQQKRTLEQAKRAAYGNVYASVMNHADYKEKSQNPAVDKDDFFRRTDDAETLPAKVSVYSSNKLITEDERGIFNYLYNTNQQDVAQEYIDWLTPQLNARLTEKTTREAAERAHQGPVQAAIESAGTVLAAPLKAVGYVEDVWNTVTGKDIDINSPTHLFSNISGAVRGQVAEDIRGATDGFFLNDFTKHIGIDNVGAFAYDTVMSMADNAVNMAIAGGATGALGLTGTAAQHAAGAISSVLMGSQVAADAVIEAKQHGDSDIQAVALGFVRGAIEAATEKWSIDNILNTPGSTLGKVIQNDLLRGFVSEGSEEVMSNWANRLVDSIVYSDEKSLRARMDAYIAQGMPEWKALATVLYDDLKEDIPAALAGGLSGMGMSGIGKGMGLISETRQVQDARQAAGQQIRESGNLNTLLSEADVSGDRKAQRIGEKVQNKAARDRQTERIQRSTDRKAGQLYDRLANVTRNQAQKSIQKEFRTGMEAALETEHAQAILQEQHVSAADAAELLYKAEYGKLTKQEQKIFEGIGGEQFLSDMLDTEAFQGNIGREAISATENADRVRGLLWKKLSPIESEAFGAVADSMTDDSTLAMVDAYQKTKGADAAVFAQNWRLAYQFGKAGVQKDSSRIQETDFAISPEQVEMARSLGAYDAVREAAQSSAQQAEEHETVEVGTLKIRDEYGLSDAGADVIQGHWSTSLGISPAVYNKAVRAAYRAGRIGDIRALEGSSVQALPADIRRSIYDEGEKYSREEAGKRRRLHESIQGKKKSPGHGPGKVEYQGIARESLTQVQRVQADVLEATLARGAGINLVFFQSKKDQAGRSIGDSGFYDPNTNTIHVDINAGESVVQDSILFTASHELTHWVAYQMPDKFHTFARFLIENFSKNDVPVDQLIQKKQREYDGISYMDAYEEVVCEACQEFLLRSDAKEKLAALAQQDRGLVQRIGDYIHELFQRMMNALRDWKAEGDEARYMRELAEETVTDLQQLWSDLVMEAAQMDAAGDGGAVKYQIRNVNGEHVVWIEDNILKQNKGLPEHQFIANYLAEHIGDVYTIIESGQKVYIGKDLSGEYTQSKYTKQILNRKPGILKVKNRSVAGIGEMIEIATNRRWEKTRHTASKDAKYGMYRYDTKIGFPFKDAGKT